MKKSRILYYILAILIGIIMFVYAEIDDSPGGQMIGLISVVIGIVGIASMIINKKKTHNKTKKIAYITLFIFLGILFQFLIHSLVEIWYINLLHINFSKYSLGFSWNELFLIHHLLSIVFLIIGALLGFWQGKFWWHKIYKK